MKRNMTASLFQYERIRTTKAKALEVRRNAEKMITRAKEDSVHNRRIIGKDIKDQEILAKLFTDIGPRYKQRAGGYTRILKLGPRKGDAAEMVLLELVSEEKEEPKKGRRKSKKAEKAQKQTEEEAAASAEEEIDTETEPAEAVETSEETATKAAEEVPEQESEDEQQNEEEKK
jgi:large subunit ribosomal protein L17